MNHTEQKKENDNFLVQGGILAVASILVRFIGMIYRVPMTNIIGDEGNTCYSNAYEFYNILLLSSRIVTGPSLSSSTFISAPKLP